MQKVAILLFLLLFCFSFSSLNVETEEKILRKVKFTDYTHNGMQVLQCMF